MLELLLVDPVFPKSVACLSAQIDTLLQNLARTAPALQDWTLGSVVLPQGEMDRSARQELLLRQLEELAERSRELANRFAARFFAHVDDDARLLSA